MKKFICGIISLALFLCIALTLIFRSGEKEETVLRCDSNGDFTILVVSDPQCDNAAQWEEARTELETLVLRAEPDFVLINGDMNSDNKIPSDMWDRFISPLTERGIYWSTTNGNHDPFQGKYYQMYKSYDECLNSKVSIYDSNYEYGRPMNYVIPIYSNDGKALVFAIYGMDTGTDNKKGYEGLSVKQISWYEKQSEKFKRLNGGNPVTSVLCMHIPLPQTIDMFYSIEGGGVADGKTAGGMYKVYGITNEADASNQKYICENGTVVPDTRFHTTAPENDRGMFDSILKRGDIKAVFFGHDHRTNFAGSYKGVILGFAGKLSTGCYSDELCRGGRVLKFNQSNPQSFTVSWLASLETSQDQPPIYSDGSLAKEKS